MYINMTRFTKPTYEELEYKHRFHFASALNTSTMAQNKKKIKISNCLITHHATKTYGGVGVWLHAFFFPNFSTG